MAELQAQLEARLHPLAGPYLFVGAGLSRRYAGLPSWEGLLRHFAEATPHRFEYYRGAAESKYPLTASKIAADFYQLWWDDPAYNESRDVFASGVSDESSPLKVEVARYVEKVVNASSVPNDLADEWELLKASTVDGIITTNYDSVLEKLFPDFEVFVGQDELLFSDTQGIAEIYKIHGSAGVPDSLVLTDKDYEGFHERNPYLAAKLLTIFVEHPIVFLGYSLTDQNVQEILQSLVVGLREQNVNKLQQRLIFVEWGDGVTPSLTDTVLPIGEVTLPITRIHVPDFREVFAALGKRRRAIPAKVLRLLKEQVYDIVLTNDPSERLVAFTDIDSDTAKDVEVVFGVGAKYATVGVVGLTRREVLLDILDHPSRNLPPQIVLDQFYERMQAGWWVPGFKYLAQAGHLDATGELLTDAAVKEDIRARVATTVARINAECLTVNGAEKKTMAELRASHEVHWLLANGFKLPALTDDVSGIREFLVWVEDNEDLSQAWHSHFARSVLAYDYMKYGPGSV